MANMGGIAIDASAWPNKYVDHDLWYLTPAAVDLALQWDPNIAKEITTRTIEDKSKTNALARTIVCMQALWFMAQCISRVVQALPITVLEASCPSTFKAYTYAWF